jgi:hypothetical protein
MKTKQKDKEAMTTLEACSGLLEQRLQELGANRTKMATESLKGTTHRELLQYRSENMDRIRTLVDTAGDDESIQIELLKLRERSFSIEGNRFRVSRR